MVAVGRALMARPKLILMDEPSMGLAPTLVDKIYEIIRQIKALGTSMLIVEQNATMALSVVEPRLRPSERRNRTAKARAKSCCKARPFVRPTSEALSDWLAIGMVQEIAGDRPHKEVQ